MAKKYGKCDPSNPNMGRAYKENFDTKRNRFSAIYDVNVIAGKGQDLRQKRPNGIKFDKGK
jgi:hypothetical protein